LISTRWARAAPLRTRHNPNAKIPLDHAWLTGLAQFCFKDDQQLSLIPEHHVWSSMTMLMKLISDKAGKERLYEARVHPFRLNPFTWTD
jgi:hypothetical protein